MRDRKALINERRVKEGRYECIEKRMENKMACGAFEDRAVQPVDIIPLTRIMNLEK